MNAGLLDHVHVLFRLGQEHFFVAHLVGAPAAAGLVVPGDAEVDTGFLQYLHRGLGQLLHGGIVTGQTAHVEKDIHLFLGGVFYVQSLGPIAALALDGDHGAGLLEAGDNLVQGGAGLAVFH